MTMKRHFHLVAEEQDRMAAFGFLLILCSLNAVGSWSSVRDCPQNGVWLQSSQKCLMVLHTINDQEFKSVYEARQKCWSVGGEIASIDSNSTDTALGLLQTAYWLTLTRGAYIGLNDINEEGSWTWIDGSDLDPQMMTLWDSGEPNSGAGGGIKDEDCVVMRAGGQGASLPQLHDYPCCLPSGIRIVLCQVTDEQLTASAIKGNESLPDDNDPLALDCVSEVNECIGKEVKCDNGGSCLDKLGRYECLCTDGYTGRHCESDINDCEEAECLNNATCRDLHASYECICETGFDGKHCETAICPKPPDFANATQEGNDVQEGSIVRYTCDSGYGFQINNSDVRISIDLICSDHNWTFVNQSDAKYSRPPDLPHCEPVRCPDLKSWTGINGEYVGLRFGDVVTYSCFEGKQFDVQEDADNLTTTCQSDGTWNPPVLGCRYFDTGKKEKIEPVEAPGAAAIGTIAIIFITLEVALIVLMDVDHLIRHAKMFKDNIAVGVNRLIN